MKVKVKWTNDTYNKFIKYLKSIGDKKTKEFNQKICNTKYSIIGIKVPILKSIAKDISKTDIREFLKYSFNSYYEEIMIEGLVIGYIEDPNEFLDYFHRFISKIDCWSLCDCCISSYKIMKKEDFSDVAYSLILDSREYYIRVGYVILLDYYIDKEHINNILSLCMKESDYYYVNMAISWLLSVCFIKFREDTLKLLESKKLSPFVQNKTISKIKDSYRVSKLDKDTVSLLKI